MEKTINHYKDTVVKELKDNLEALVLVGSFARGEGIPSVSDIEFWAVVKDLRDKKGFDFPKQDVSVGFTTRSHLKHLKPYIYTVEALKFGKILWGDKDILSIIPKFDYKDIDPIDGFILLNNRIVEQLILLGKIEQNEPLFNFYFDKGYIQLANSYLAFHKRYCGLYPQKKKAFSELCKNTSPELVRNILSAFDSLATNTTRTFPREAALEKWHNLRSGFKEIWSEQSKLFPGMKDRIEGWAKALRKNLFHPHPRFNVYRNASELYFSDNYRDQNKRESIIKEWELFIK